VEHVYLTLKLIFRLSCGVPPSRASHAVRLASLKFAVHHIWGTQNVTADTVRLYESDDRLPVSPFLLHEDNGNHRRADRAICRLTGRLLSGQYLFTL
jgi:hypothetical protein